jgi:hypothetical protein
LIGRPQAFRSQNVPERLRGGNEQVSIQVGVDLLMNQGIIDA